MRMTGPGLFTPSTVTSTAPTSRPTSSRIAQRSPRKRNLSRSPVVCDFQTQPMRPTNQSSASCSPFHSSCSFQSSPSSIVSSMSTNFAFSRLPGMNGVTSFAAWSAGGSDAIAAKPAWTDFR